MSARCLLLIARGGGTFSLPAASVRTLASAPTGIGSTATDPRGFYDATSNKTFFAAVNGTTGNVMAWEYNHTTKTATSPVSVGSSGSADVHSGPSIIARTSDGRLVCGWNPHGGATLYIAISTNPRDATAWGAPVNIASQVGGSSNRTYVSLAELSSEGKLYVFWRDYTGTYGRIAYSTSSDNGATWAAATLLVTASGTAGEVVYWRMGTNWTDRIDIVTTDNDRTAPGASLYHLYYLSGAWHQSDGTTISATKPFTASNGTLVASNSLGSNGVTGVGLDGTGAPFCVFLSSTGTSNKVYTGRWRSSAWQVDQVTDTNGYLAGNHFHGNAAIQRGNPDLVFSAVKVGSFFEVKRYTSADDGATWSETAITTGSASDAMDLETPARASAGLQVFWSFGTYTNDSSFSVGTKGYG